MVRPLIMKTEKKITLDKKNCENLPNFVTFKELHCEFFKKLQLRHLKLEIFVTFP